ncbi:probable ATP-dependent RNA helicase kurz [Penaeus japonicus]|uniref:probable ATP-dependent RNA helicase kurz n=1 Tax=Penaeus japonicus TaxID=27405 RepID=UPI001C710578|nr:probable ATP-dependent RNA helicase kurz [Penaeus japonicus]
MGRARQKYRERPVVVADESKQKKIKVDIGNEADSYDTANALVLPSEKRATKKLRDKNAAPVKLLSRKKRKLLEKVVDQKKKKAKRSELLEALEKVQASSEELSLLTQLQSTQTLGRKKYLSEDFTLITKQEVEEEGGRVVSVIKGRKRRKALDDNGEREKKHRDPTVVRLGEVSSSEESEEDEEEEEYVEEEDHERENGEAIKEENDEEGKEENTEEVEKGEEVTDKDKRAEKSLEPKEQREEPKEMVDKAQVVPAKPAVFVVLDRSPEVQANRLKLPILSEEQIIMEAINENPVTVIVGATGSGKTTQVPQFLYEAGYTSNSKMIGVTEPRRVAAIAMSQRVGHEMNLTSDQVSYQIRFEGNATPDTKIKFMTDGVLLKEIQKDPTLKKYSVIIIDEAHERSVFSDILIGILSRIIPRRQAKGRPLKLVIMSATLRVEDFTDNVRLFKEPKPPVMKVDARMFDVTIHYNKRTNEDYVGEAYKKACKIHRQLPDGGILIFLTGQQEVNTVVRKLRTTFPSHSGSHGETKKSAYQRKKEELKAKKERRKSGQPEKVVLPKVKLEDFVSAFPDDAEGEVEDFMTEIEDRGVVDHEDSDLDLDEEEEDEEGRRNELEQPMWVVPLYSMLPPEKQQMVFQPPPEGMRLCVVATNVAETSLTIPNIKYVIDCGKVKEKVYDKVTGVSMFHVTWTAQASANQRAGRAGRTAPGHCYRLYSSAVFNDEFQKFATPEIQRRPIDDLVLVMKSMNLPVINFPFPTPPDHLQVRSGMQRLIILGGLDERELTPQEAAAAMPPKRGKRRMQTPKPVNRDLSYITPLGRAMAAFPLAPRYGKMLALSHQHNLLPYTVALVAALTVQEVLIETPLDSKANVNETRKRWQNLRLSWAGTANSRSLGDAMVLLRAVGAAEYQGGDREWCDKNGLRHKGIVEIRKLRRQLTNEINMIIPSCNLVLDPHMSPPTDDEARLLRQIMLAGAVDHVARRVDDNELKNSEDKQKWKYAYRTQDMEEPVFLPSSSVTRVDMPKWVIYQDVYETHKMFMRTVTAIEPEWLATFAPKLCNFSPPLETPEPRYDSERDKILCHRTATFGPSAWEIPEVEVEYPYSRELFPWVAFYFLTGDICPALKPFKEYLFEPRTLVNPVAIRYREQRDKILRALMSQKVTNYAKLEQLWKEQPKFLQKEYLLWFQDTELHGEVVKIWPPLIPKEVNEWE